VLLLRIVCWMVPNAQVTLMRGATDSIYELVSGYGEVWSASMLAAFLNQNTRYVCFGWSKATILMLGHEDTASSS
jgi:aspartokinase